MYLILELPSTCNKNLELKGEIEKPTIMVGELKSPFSGIDETRQNVHTDTKNNKYLNNTALVSYGYYNKLQQI